MVSIRSRWLWFVVAIGAVAAGLWLARELHRDSPVLASGTWLPAPRELTELALTDETGKPLTLARLRGAPTMVYFGFTSCPDVCPTTLATLARVRKAAQMPALGVLLISVDPEHDTPALLEKYVHAFDPSFKGATGKQADIGRLTREFGVVASRAQRPAGGYTVDHSATLYLLDAKARMAAIFTPPFDVPRLAKDLRTAAPALQ